MRPATPHAADQPLRFGPYELQPTTRQLLMQGQELRIGGRAFDLLSHLAANRHRVVSHAELLDAVWPGQPVEANNLQVQIFALRRLLGARAIVTVPRRGYRLVAVDSEAPADAQPDPLDASEPGSLPRDPATGVPQLWPAMLQALMDGAPVTLIGPDPGSAEQLAFMAARQVADRSGVAVWHLDAQPDTGAGPAVLPALLQRLVTRRDLTVLSGPHCPPGQLRQMLQEATAQAPLLRWLVLASAPIGLSGEHVVEVSPALVEAGTAETASLQQRRSRPAL